MRSMRMFEIELQMLLEVGKFVETEQVRRTAYLIGNVRGWKGRGYVKHLFNHVVTDA